MNKFTINISYNGWLLRFILATIVIFSLYLIVALVSFNPADPSWIQASLHVSIHNLAGRAGAWLADTLFLIFGIIAYVIPIIMLFFCWNIFLQHNYIDFFMLSLRIISILLLMLTSCGLVALNVDDPYYYPSGGIIGSLLSNIILQWLNYTNAVIILLCIWSLGVMLFTNSLR